MSKPVLVARVYIDYRDSLWSKDYAHIGVNFSLMGFENPRNPSFHGLYDVPEAQRALTKLIVEGQLDAETVKSGNLPYGYNLALSENNPSLRNAEEFVKVGRGLQRKQQKISDEEGNPKDMVEYLKQLFRAMKVKYVTFESLDSEDKFKRYKLADIDNLINIAVKMVANKKNWELSQ